MEPAKNLCFDLKSSLQLQSDKRK